MAKTHSHLQSNHSGSLPEAGCDEAGRGCLAGPVFAAAVILPVDFFHADLTDSKKLNEKKRDSLRKIIEAEAMAFHVAKLDAPDVDKYNILWASVRAMHLALDHLTLRPQHIIVDGNKFLPYADIEHTTIIKGDSLYASIAAASILAKTYRDEYMIQLHQSFPQYHWDANKGYPSIAHRDAIRAYGVTMYHRQSFQLLPRTEQLQLFD
jgi:ribonuclease HII